MSYQDNGSYLTLSFAIRKNSSNLVQKILNQPNVLIKDENWTDYTLLIKALQRGCRRIVKLLIKNGCRVNRDEKTNFFHTPLYYAVRLRDSQLVKILLYKGALINDTDFNKETALRLALNKKYYNIVDIILSNYLQQIVDVSTLNDNDYIAFNAACLRNNKYIVQSFINRNILIKKLLNSDNEVDCTPLHIAVKHQSVEVIDILLKSGADGNIKNGIGQTPLHLAYYIKESCYPPKDCKKIIDMILCQLKRTNLNPTDNSGLSHFHIACTTDQTDVVKHFLQLQVDINNSVNLDSSIYPGYTPLHFALENKQKNIVELLLNNGADVTIKNKTGNTPFHFAFNYFYTDNDLVELVLSKHISKNINPINNIGLSHFHIACTTGNISAIESFLENKVSTNAAVNFDSQKCAGYTPLHFAVNFNRKTTVEILLKHDANLNLKEKEGLTPLHLACQQNAKKIHTILRNSVPNSNSYEKINFVHVFKQSPSKFLESIAKQTEQIEIIDLLMQYKSDINSHDNLGKTPLFYACYIDHQTFVCEFGTEMSQPLYNIMNEFYMKRNRIIEILLRYKSDVNTYDKNGRTVLHSIADIKNIFRDEWKAEVAEMLLSAGADVNARTQEGLTPLHIALKRSYLDLIEIFLKCDIDPNIADYIDLCTPLHLATSNELLAPVTENIIHTLLIKGADVDSRNREGRTPLHIAASTRYSTNRLKRLLEVDCDTNCQDIKGKTPLHMACINRNPDNVENLLNHGADMNITDEYGKTPYYYYYQYQNEVLESREHVHNFHEIYYIFRNHIRRLKTIDYFVNWDNMTYYMELKAQYKIINNGEGDNISKECEEEVMKMKSIKLNSYSSLYDILYKDPNEMTIYIKNDNLLKVVETKRFGLDFKRYGSFIKLKLQRGQARNKLLKSAKNALISLIRFNLPDSCSEKIFGYLSNRNLKDLIKAETLVLA